MIPASGAVIKCVIPSILLVIKKSAWSQLLSVYSKTFQNLLGLWKLCCVSPAYHADCHKNHLLVKQSYIQSDIGVYNYEFSIFKLCCSKKWTICTHDMNPVHLRPAMLLFWDKEACENIKPVRNDSIFTLKTTPIQYSITLLHLCANNPTMQCVTSIPYRRVTWCVKIHPVIIILYLH